MCVRQQRHVQGKEPVVMMEDQQIPQKESEEVVEGDDIHLIQEGDVGQETEDQLSSDDEPIVRAPREYPKLRLSEGETPHDPSAYLGYKFSTQKTDPIGPAYIAHKMTRIDPLEGYQTMALRALPFDDI